MSNKVQNIRRVNKETDLDAFLNEHSDQVAVVMYKASSNPNCRVSEARLFNESLQNGDCWFVIVDIDSFEESDGKYLKKVTSTPHFSFFYNLSNMANIIGSDHQQFIQMLTFLKTKIADVQVQQNQRPVHAPPQPRPSRADPDYAEKVDLLTRLHALTQEGVILSQHFSVESDIRLIRDEYNTRMHNRMLQQKQQQLRQPNFDNAVNVTSAPQHAQQTYTPMSTPNRPPNSQLTGHPTSMPPTGLISSQVEQLGQPDQSTPMNIGPSVTLPGGVGSMNGVTMSKQEQIKKIQELTNLNRVVQMQNMAKLQKMQYVQQQKENYIRNQRNSNSNSNH